MAHAATVAHLSLILGLRMEAYLIQQRPRLAPGRRAVPDRRGCRAPAPDPVGDGRLQLGGRPALSRHQLIGLPPVMLSSRRPEGFLGYSERAGSGFADFAGSVFAGFVGSGFAVVSDSGFAGTDFAGSVFAGFAIAMPLWFAQSSRTFHDAFPATTSISCFRRTDSTSREHSWVLKEPAWQFLKQRPV